jgi:adenylate cyclase
MIDSAIKWESCLTREVTALRADLRGVSTISMELLNRIYSTMSEIIFRHRGTIDRFGGDSLLVTFESTDEIGDCARRAVSCAVDMQTAMEGLNVVSRAEGSSEVFFGIGINTGRVLSTVLGSDLYAEYAGIGDEVNLASRIESFSLRGQVLLSESAYQRCGGFVKAGAPVDFFVQGKSKLVPLREVQAIPSLAKSVPRQDERRSPRARITVPFSYRMVVNNVAVPEAREGTIIDIGYYGVLAEIRLPISQSSRVQLEFELPLVNERFRNFNGKVVKVLKKSKTRTLVGIEFAAMTSDQRAAVQTFVQMLIQAAQ